MAVCSDGERGLGVGDGDANEGAGGLVEGEDEVGGEDDGRADLGEGADVHGEDVAVELHMAEEIQVENAPRRSRSGTEEQMRRREIDELDTGQSLPSDSEQKAERSWASAEPEP